MIVHLEIDLTSDEIDEAEFRPAQLHSALFNLLTGAQFVTGKNSNLFKIRVKRAMTEDAARGGEWVTSW